MSSFNSNRKTAKSGGSKHHNNSNRQHRNNNNNSNNNQPPQQQPAAMPPPPAKPAVNAWSKPLQTKAPQLQAQQQPQKPVASTPAGTTGAPANTNGKAPPAAAATTAPSPLSSAPAAVTPPPPPPGYKAQDANPGNIAAVSTAKKPAATSSSDLKKPVSKGPPGIPTNTEEEIKNRDRALQMFLNITGQSVKCHLKSGVVLEGVLHTATPFDIGDGQHSYVYLLKRTRVIAGKDDSIETGSTVVVPMKEVAHVNAPQIKLSTLHKPSASGSTSAVVGSAGGFTDCEISGSRNVHSKDRTLQAAGSAWTSAGVGTDSALESSVMTTRGTNRRAEALAVAGNLGGGSSNKRSGQLEGSIGTWDQFQANEALFNVKASFDESMYTTQLDRSQLDESKIKRAEQLAKEIESAPSANIHLQQERNQSTADDYDEEDLHSGVLRDLGVSGSAAVAAAPKQKQLSLAKKENKETTTKKEKEVPKEETTPTKKEPPAAPAKEATAKKESPAIKETKKKESPAIKETRAAKELVVRETTPSITGVSVKKPDKSDADAAPTMNYAKALQQNDSNPPPLTTTEELPKDKPAVVEMGEEIKLIEESAPESVNEVNTVETTTQVAEKVEKPAEEEIAATLPPAQEGQNAPTAAKFPPAQEEYCVPTAATTVSDEKSQASTRSGDNPKMQPEKQKSKSKLNANAKEFTLNINAKTFTPSFSGPPPQQQLPLPPPPPLHDTQQQHHYQQQMQQQHHHQQQQHYEMVAPHHPHIMQAMGQHRMMPMMNPQYGGPVRYAQGPYGGTMEQQMHQMLQHPQHMQGQQHAGLMPSHLVGMQQPPPPPPHQQHQPGGVSTASSSPMPLDAMGAPQDHGSIVGGADSDSQSSSNLQGQVPQQPGPGEMHQPQQHPMQQVPHGMHPASGVYYQPHMVPQRAPMPYGQPQYMSGPAMYGRPQMYAGPMGPPNVLQQRPAYYGGPNGAPMGPGGSQYHQGYGSTGYGGQVGEGDVMVDGAFVRGGRGGQSRGRGGRHHQSGRGGQGGGRHHGRGSQGGGPGGRGNNQGRGRNSGRNTPESGNEGGLMANVISPEPARHAVAHDDSQTESAL